MMRRWISLALAVAGLAAAGPLAANPAEETLRAEIAKERTAHLTYDADLLVSLFADDFTSVDSGRVTRPTREESRARLQRYFDAVRFRAWDDIAPPQITLSPDGQLATVLIQKLVRTVDRAQADDPNAPVSETRFAWLETWRRDSRGWRLIQVVSTRAAE